MTLAPDAALRIHFAQWMTEHGEAVQVDPVKPTLKASEFKLVD
jgi:hypothetical protein